MDKSFAKKTSLTISNFKKRSNYKYIIKSRKMPKKKKGHKFQSNNQDEQTDINVLIELQKMDIDKYMSQNAKNKEFDRNLLNKSLFSSQQTNNWQRESMERKKQNLLITQAKFKEKAIDYSKQTRKKNSNSHELVSLNKINLHQNNSIGKIKKKLRHQQENPQQIFSNLKIKNINHLKISKGKNQQHNQQANSLTMNQSNNKSNNQACSYKLYNDYIFQDEQQVNQYDLQRNHYHRNQYNSKLFYSGEEFRFKTQGNQSNCRFGSSHNYRIKKNSKYSNSYYGQSKAPQNGPFLSRGNLDYQKKKLQYLMRKTHNHNESPNLTRKANRSQEFKEKNPIQNLIGVVDLELPAQINLTSEDKKMNQLFMIMKKGKNNPDLINKFFQIKLNYKKNNEPEIMSNQFIKMRLGSKNQAIREPLQDQNDQIIIRVDQKAKASQSYKEKVDLDEQNIYDFRYQ